MIVLLLLGVATSAIDPKTDKTESNGDNDAFVDNSKEEMTVQKAEEELKPIVESVEGVVTSTKKTIKYLSKKLKSGFDTAADYTKKNAPEVYEGIAKAARAVEQTAEKIQKDPKVQEIAKQAKETVSTIAKNVMEAVNEVASNEHVKETVKNAKDTTEKAVGSAVKMAKKIRNEINEEIENMAPKEEL